jgi:transcriptional antiterminator NusG
MGEAITGRIFAVKTTGGQEKSVANFVVNRAQMRETRIYSVMVFDNMKAYIFIEAPNAQIVGESISGVKHVKSQVPGIIQIQDIEKFLVVKSIITELAVDDKVEVIAGPFKGMQARITRIESVRKEVTVILLDAPYQLPVTIDADYLKIVEKGGGG